MADSSFGSIQNNNNNTFVSKVIELDFINDSINAYSMST